MATARVQGNGDRKGRHYTSRLYHLRQYETTKVTSIDGGQERDGLKFPLQGE